ncbi:MULTISPECIES: KAP family P-loop NTPase fold protein [unclassified Leifsonia]|uniref:KAP family P-loop NTPase fold protein n=1 Tax=unclassified Leifsonia TaxID=2663824 RepID=UPI0014150311|nr:MULTISPECIES: P-loop NTPase fold protein [unclassified Leifsonia]
MRLVVRLAVAISVLYLCGVAVLTLSEGDRQSNGAVHQWIVSVLYVGSPFALALISVLVIAVGYRIAPKLPVDVVEPSPERPQAWADHPVDLEATDDYDRLAFVSSLVRVLSAVRVSRDSSVIGLAGPWGAGKTSVLITLMNELARSETSSGAWAIGQLNPWRYSSLDSLTAAFFVQLRAAIPTGQRWDDSRAALGRLLASLAPFGSLTAAAGFDSSKGLESLARQMGVGDWWRTQSEAETALRRLDTPILMVIDDIDRLTPAEVLELMRLIRQVGRLPNVHYLLAYDETSLLDLIAESGIAGKSAQRAREYLEKMIQIRVDIPPLRPRQLNMAVDAVLDPIVESDLTGRTAERGAEFAFTFQIYIAPALTTPRKVERWLTHIRLLYPPLEEDVDFFDFAIIRWACLEWPRLAEFLVSHRTRLFPDAIWFAEHSNDDPAEATKWWREHLDTVAGSRESGELLFGVLARMFPTIEGARHARAVSSNPDAVRNRRGIGHPDFFERYFALDVPVEELTERVLAAGLEEVVFQTAARQAIEARAKVEAALLEQSSQIAPRVERWVQENKSGTKRIMQWVADKSRLADDEDLLSSRRILRGLLFRLALADDQTVALANELWDSPGDPVVAAQLAADLLSEARINQRQIEDLRSFASTRISDRLSADSRPEPLRTRGTRRLLWLWLDIDPQSSREWYRRQITSGASEVVDALAALVGSAHPIGVRDPVPTLTGLSDATIEAFLGLDWLATRLKQNTHEFIGPRMIANDFDGPEDTWPNRRAVALAALDKLRGATEDESRG